MRVGELFIELGLKGADATARGLEDTSKAVRDVASDALKAVAAISALFYGFRKLAGQSEQTGLGLKQFTDITGLSADQLQRWQQLAIDFGESADEMTGDIKNIQQTMTDTVLKGKFPEYIQAINIALANAGKQGITPDNARDTFGVMDKLRSYAKITAGNPDIARTMAQSFHISDKTYGALRTSNFDLNKDFDKSRAYNGSQINSLAQLSVGWNKLFDRIEHSIGKLNIQFGPRLLKDITGLIPEVERLVRAFAQMAEHLKLISYLGKAFKGWGEIFKGISDLSEYTNSHTPKDLLNLVKNQFHGTNISDIISDTFTGTKISDGISGKQTTNNISVTVHGVEGDSGSIGAEIAAHVSQAFRQLPQGGSSGGGH